MARMRPAYYYERQAAEAQRRADYFRTRTPPVEAQQYSHVDKPRRYTTAA